MEGIPIVVPVRWSWRGAAVQTTSGWLSLEAIFVRGLDPPTPGATLAVHLSLPGDGPAEQLEAVARGSVVRCANGESGFWARFLGLPVASRRRIGRFLKGRNAALTALSRRAFPRAPLRRQVHVRADSTGAFVAHTQNISRGGMFITAALPPALHEVVEVRLKLPDRLGPVHTKAVVVQRVLAHQTRGRRSGAGLQFIDADDSFRERLDNCLENLLAVPLKTA